MRHGNASDVEWSTTENGETTFRPKQRINDTDEPLRYLAVSTMIEPDVTIYPDSEKFGVYVGSPPGGREERALEGYFEQDAAVDYWQDER